MLSTIGATACSLTLDLYGAIQCAGADDCRGGHRCIAGSCQRASDEPLCGDYVVEDSESCDDGNNIDGDGCEADCVKVCAVPDDCPDDFRCVQGVCAVFGTHACGDFVVEGSESCDDGNNIDGDGCQADCVKPCGSPGDCPSGFRCALGMCAVAGSPLCGDFVVEGDESCDDGDTIDGDGCQADCVKPCTGSWGCSYSFRCALGFCRADNGPFCGDYVTEGAEECDDGNDLFGDLCRPDCTRIPCGTNGYLGDSNNCGTCGTSCYGGECRDTVCQPLILALDADVWNPRSIAVDATHVYWTEGGFGGSQRGRIRKVPLAGGTIESVASSQDGADAIALDGNDVYWTINFGNPNGRIRRINKDIGCCSTTLVDQVDGPGAISVGGVQVYFGGADATSESLGYIDKTAALNDWYIADRTYSPLTGLTSESPGLFYCLANGSIKWVQWNGTVSTLVTGAPSPTDIAIADFWVYWINYGTAANNYTDGSVRFTDFGLSASTQGILVSDINRGNSIAVDSSHVYFIDEVALQRVPIGGGTVELLWPGRGDDIALDANFVYWLGEDVLRIHK